jgi:SAM-dependent methyltransferase
MTTYSAGVSDRAYSEWKGWEAAPFGDNAEADTSYFRREIRRVEKISGPIRSALEVGFGNGSFLGYCRRNQIDAVGTEINEDRLQAASSAGYAVHPAAALASIDRSGFDIAAVFDVLEHLSSSEAMDLLRTLRAKVRPGGAIILRFPNADYWIGNVNQFGDPTHISQIGYLKLMLYAQQANLEVAYYGPEARRGFGAGFAKGLHEIVTYPVRVAIGCFLRIIYSPGSPLVFTTKNTIAILRKSSEDERT